MDLKMKMEKLKIKKYAACSNVKPSEKIGTFSNFSAGSAGLEAPAPRQAGSPPLLWHLNGKVFGENLHIFQLHEHVFADLGL